MSKTYEKCGICGEHKEDTFDGLCEKCEPLFMNEVSILSKVMPKNTPLKDLFLQAARNASSKYLNNKN